MGGGGGGEEREGDRERKERDEKESESLRESEMNFTHLQSSSICLITSLLSSSVGHSSLSLSLASYLSLSLFFSSPKSNLKNEHILIKALLVKEFHQPTSQFC